MTLEQIIAEVAAQPTQVKAFAVLMECLQSEMNDASLGNTPPPSVQSKYDTIFSEASGKANEILTAIEKGKPDLEPVAPKSPSDPGGPKTAVEPVVFVDKPKTEPVTPIAATPHASTIPSPFGGATPTPSP